MSAPNLSRQNTANRRITDVAQTVMAMRLLGVCMAGASVAMHLSTASGIVVVRMPLMDFIEKTQTGRDHLGNRFVMPRKPEQAEADAAATTPKRAPIGKPNGQLL